MKNSQVAVEIDEELEDWASRLRDIAWNAMRRTDGKWPGLFARLHEELHELEQNQQKYHTSMFPPEEQTDIWQTDTRRPARHQTVQERQSCTCGDQALPRGRNCGGHLRRRYLRPRDAGQERVLDHGYSLPS
jgi:hypothetical protein